MQDDFIYDRDDYIEFEKSGDTLINGREAVLIEEWYIDLSGSGSPFHVGSHILEMRNGVTSYYVADIDSFYVMFDYNLEVGDTLYSYCPDIGSSVRFKVIANDSIMISDEFRPVQILDPIDFTCSLSSYNLLGFEGLVIDGIGSLEYLFPRPEFFDPPPGGILVCYTQDSIIYSPSPGPCEFVVSNKDVNPDNDIRVYPSPTSDVVYIEGNGIHEVSIYTLYGQLIGREAGNMVDLRDVQDGVYVLLIKTWEGVNAKTVVRNGN